MGLVQGGGPAGPREQLPAPGAVPGQGLLGSGPSAWRHQPGLDDLTGNLSNFRPRSQGLKPHPRPTHSTMSTPGSPRRWLSPPPTPRLHPPRLSVCQQPHSRPFISCHSSRPLMLQSPPPPGLSTVSAGLEAWVAQGSGSLLRTLSPKHECTPRATPSLSFPPRAIPPTITIAPHPWVPRTPLISRALFLPIFSDLEAHAVRGSGREAMRLREGAPRSKDQILGVKPPFSSPAFSFPGIGRSKHSAEAGWVNGLGSHRSGGQLLRWTVAATGIGSLPAPAPCPGP